MNDEKKIVFLDVNDILPNRFQPRIKFKEDSLNELSESIKKYGVIEPIVVRPIGDKYEIIAGERRYKACLLAGQSKVPSIITSLDDKDSAEVALIENVQREDLTPIEEAVSYKKILEMGYLTQEELATKLGKNQGTVANKLRLLNLTEEVQEALLESKISERHARSLLKLKNNQQQIDMLNKIISNRLTVRKTDEEIDKVLQGKGEEKMSDFNPFASNNEQNIIPEFNAFASEQKEEVMNPGFMDVNKIEENAADINVARENADMSALLEPTNMPTLEPTVEEQPQQEEPVVEESKFFNIPLEQEVDLQQTTPVQSDEDAFASSLNEFNQNQPAFDFNFTPIEQKQSINEEPTILPLQEEPEFNYAGILNETPATDNNIPSLQTEEVLAVQPEIPQSNLMQAVEIIRNCGKQLEAMGFKVNVDEVDLSNLYQVTFNIEK